MNNTTKLTPEQIFQIIYSRSQKYVKNYREDYDIDKKIILSRPDTPFIHISRRNGTALNLFFKIDAYKDATTKVFKVVIKNLSDSINHYLTQVEPLCILYYDREKVTKITPDKARSLFADYSRSIIYQYENEFKTI